MANGNRRCDELLDGLMGRGCARRNCSALCRLRQSGLGHGILRARGACKGFQFGDNAIQFFDQRVTSCFAKCTHQRAVIPQRAFFLALKSLEHAFSMHPKIVQGLPAY